MIERELKDLENTQQELNKDIKDYMDLNDTSYKALANNYNQIYDLYYKFMIRCNRYEEKLQRIENYLDRHSDIPIEVVVNIKNIIHSEVEDEVI